ncbi:DUF1493 family protein [Erwinia mallotivora]|uniref:DUF1493 family protein n=1 Tax=Erwinia mallotivora TaxID=69222 RepID=UPI0021C01D46|nr:DUF1493 family protein [Erwinia mallotivora]
MELNEDIAASVISWYEENYNLKPLFAKKKPVLTSETSLSTGDYPWARETGDDIMKDYFSRFCVDNSGFDFIKYWPYEKGMIPNFLRPRSMRVEEKEPEELTIMMLIESAKAGRWLY